MSISEYLDRNKIPEDEDYSSERRDNPHSAIKAETHSRLLDTIDFERIEGLPPSEQDEAVRVDVANELDRVISEEGYRVSRNERDQMIQELIDRITGYGPLQKLIENDRLQEIWVNGPKKIYVEHKEKGSIKRDDIEFRDEEHVKQIINKIVRPLGRRVDEQQPYADARLPDGSRVNVIIPPLVSQGPTITIRKHDEEPPKIGKLIEDWDTLTRRMADFLKACVKAKLNIVISGGTSSGKTTTLNVLSDFIPVDERIITIEDTRELQLHQPHVVNCESRPPNIEGEGEVTIRELVKNSLRMTPDRVIIGECRGGEALDMLQAMNTGHDGSMTTVHANNPKEATSRLETLTMMAELDLPQEVIRAQIASAVDVIIQQNKLQDGSRPISSITEVLGMEGDSIQFNEIFYYEQEDLEDGKVIGHHQSSGIKPSFHEKFEQMGLDISSTMYVQKTS